MCVKDYLWIIECEGYNMGVLLKQPEETLREKVREIRGEIQKECDDLKLFHLYRKIAIYYAALCEYQHALEAQERALTIIRGIEGIDSRIQLYIISSCLNNYGAILFAMNRYYSAIKATEESLKIRRGIRDFYISPLTLSTSLNNLGVMLFATGNHKDGLKITEEALEIRRKERFALYIARSLHNLSVMLFHLGRWAEAMKAAREASELYRGIPKMSPFSSEYVRTLYILSAALTRLGFQEQAHTVHKEMERILRWERPSSVLV